MLEKLSMAHEEKKTCLRADKTSASTAQRGDCLNPKKLLVGGFLSCCVVYKNLKLLLFPCVVMGLPFASWKGCSIHPGLNQIENAFSSRKVSNTKKEICVFIPRGHPFTSYNCTGKTALRLCF